MTERQGTQGAQGTFFGVAPADATPAAPRATRTPAGRAAFEALTHAGARGLTVAELADRAFGGDLVVARRELAYLQVTNRAHELQRHYRGARALGAVRRHGEQVFVACDLPAILDADDPNATDGGR